MRIIFMGTPEFAIPSLQALLSAHEVVAVYTQPPRPKGRGLQLAPSPVQQLADKHGIAVFTPASLKSPEEQEKFRALGADVAVVVAYGLLLPKAILDGTEHGCINIHPSALPRWRGAAPIQRTIMAGDTFTDICIMQMDEGLDTGPVLLRKVHIIEPGTTAGALHDQLAAEAPPLLLEALAHIAEGTAVRTPQAADGVTYARKISKDEARIDFSKPAEEVRQHILGLSPTPGAWFEYQGERVKILHCHPGEGRDPRQATDSPMGVDPGLRRDDEGKWSIRCNPGTLYPTELQRAGGKRMGVEEFMAGFKQ